MRQAGIPFIVMPAGVAEDPRPGESALDHAGAYALRGLASKFIDRIEGCYSNVVGLPLARVYQHLKRLA